MQIYPLFFVLTFYVLLTFARPPEPLPFHVSSIHAPETHAPHPISIVDIWNKFVSDMLNAPEASGSWSGDGESDDDIGVGNFIDDLNKNWNRSHGDDRLNKVVSTTYQIYYSSKDDHDDGKVEDEVNSFMRISSPVDISNHMYTEIENLKNLSSEFDKKRMNQTHQECQSSWKKSVDWSTTIKNSVVSCQNDTESLANRIFGLQKSKLEEQANGYNMTLLEIQSYQISLRTCVANDKLRILKCLLLNSTNLNQTLNATLLSHLLHLSELQGVIDGITQSLCDVNEKIKQVEQKTDTIFNTTSVKDVKNCILKQFDRLKEHLANNITICDDAILNVTIKQHIDNDDVQLIISADTKVEVDVEYLRGIVAGGVVAVTGVHVEDIIMTYVHTKRNIDFSHLWTVAFNQSETTVDVKETYPNLTDVQLPKLSDSDVQALIQQGIKKAQDWIDNTKKLALADLKAYLVQLEDERNKISEVQNETETEFKEFVQTFKEATANYWTDAQRYLNKIASSFVGHTENDPSTHSGQGSSNDDDDVSVATQIGQTKIDQCNNTWRTIIFERHQNDIDYVKKALVVLDDKIQLVGLYILLSNDLLNQTLLNQIAALEDQVLSVIKLQVVQNGTCNDIRTLEEEWKKKTENAEQRVHDTIQAIGNKAWKTVASVKEDWKSRKTEVNDTISKCLKDILNCSVIDVDFSDLDKSENHNITFKWSLEVSDTVSLQTISSILENVLFTESCIPKTAINVVTTHTNKRATTTVTSTAVLSSSSSTTAATPTDGSTTPPPPPSGGADMVPAPSTTGAIIGGVIGGILFVIIIVGIIVFISRKSDGEKI